MRWWSCSSSFKAASVVHPIYLRFGPDCCVAARRTFGYVRACGVLPGCASLRWSQSWTDVCVEFESKPFPSPPQPGARYRCPAGVRAAGAGARAAGPSRSVRGHAAVLLPGAARSAATGSCWRRRFSAPEPATARRRHGCPDVVRRGRRHDPHASAFRVSPRQFGDPAHASAESSGTRVRPGPGHRCAPSRSRAPPLLRFAAGSPFAARAPQRPVAPGLRKRRPRSSATSSRTCRDDPSARRATDARPASSAFAPSAARDPDDPAEGHVAVYSRTRRRAPSPPKPPRRRQADPP